MPSTLPSPPELLSPEQSWARERGILQYVVDNVPYCIFWKDAESRYLGCNKNFAALAGRGSPREMIGKTDYDTAWQANADEYRRDDRETMLRDVPLISQEVVTRDSQGREMVLLTSKVPLRDEGGTIIGVLGSVVDITERKQVENELERAKNAAEGALRTKADFIANMSHEFRTPLTLIVSPLESLMAGDSGLLPGAAVVQIERAHRNALRLLGMVNDLLDFSRLDAKKQEALRERVDLAELTRQLVDDAQPLASVRRLQLEFTSLLREPTLPVDRRLFEKILMNLLGNALKFTPPDGTISVSLCDRGDEFELAVRDTGIGIAAESHARIFERFAQADHTSTRRYGGTGLGLALVKEFTELMGGHVGLESAPGAGARFSVRLPRQAPTAPRAESTIPADPVRRWSSADLPSSDTLPPDGDEVEDEALPSVLLVEDNLEMRSHLTQILRGRYRVSTVGSGKRALDLARRQRPDVIISDIMMPELDGLSLVEIVKSDEALRHIPVILLSARPAKDTAVTALEAGADDYIEKPFSAAELRARVRAAYRVGGALRREALLTDELDRVQRELGRLRRANGIEEPNSEYDVTVRPGRQVSSGSSRD
jgi:PAS domain S-box-containing protein